MRAAVARQFEFQFSSDTKPLKSFSFQLASSPANTANGMSKSYFYKKQKHSFTHSIRLEMQVRFF